MNLAKATRSLRQKVLLKPMSLRARPRLPKPYRLLLHRRLSAWPRAIPVASIRRAIAFWLRWESLSEWWPYSVCSQSGAGGAWQPC